MPSHDVRVDAIAARFSAAGRTPRVKDHGDHTCIEIGVPPSVSAEAWTELVTVLEVADWFGLVSGRSGGTVWAAISKTPATVATVRGHGQSALGS
ncbi:hypothetical protein [Streptomyces sp. bgisy100]|uniref:hypothetical protein n=1 Tax=Streptomyces sp. bgisy100 TaxID=3413783 RepID=UPI003D72FE1E